MDYSTNIPKLKQSRNDQWVWVSLIFSLFYFVPLFFYHEKFSLIATLEILGIYFLFVYFYIKANVSGVQYANQWIAGILLLSFLGASINPGTTSLFGYATFLAGYYYSGKKALLTLLICLALQCLAVWLFNLQPSGFLIPGVIISAALTLFGSQVRKDILHKLKEEQSQSQIEQLAAIAERERIARDLHDIIGHSLSCIALKAELAEKLSKSGDQQQAEAEIAEVAKLSRQSLSEVRQVVTGLKTKGLAQELKQLIAYLIEQDFLVDMDYQVDHITAKIESELTLMLREIVTNILKHSQASQVSIQLTQSSEKITMKITDNGQSHQFIEGNGLKGIRERCQKLSGQFTLEHNKGVILTIILPNQTA